MEQRVGCPACAELLPVRPEQLGRNVCCPRCGTHLTARPLNVDRLLRGLQRRIRGGKDAPLPRLPLVVLVDNVRSLWNVGSIFRSADAFGVRELVLCGITGCPPRPQISKTALDADRCVAWRYQADPLQALAGLQAQGFTAVALETSPAAVPLEELEWPRRVCLVVGNEVAGVSRALLETCSRHVRIPMLGAKESLNVAVAFGIAAHQAARALAAMAGEGAAGPREGAERCG